MSNSNNFYPKAFTSPELYYKLPLYSLIILSVEERFSKNNSFKGRLVSIITFVNLSYSYMGGALLDSSLSMSDSDIC